MKATAYINFAAGKAKYCINSNLSHVDLQNWDPRGTAYLLSSFDLLRAVRDLLRVVRDLLRVIRVFTIILFTFISVKC
ncbi:hypothetical protein T11_10338 [Trichinella zimbabwensis]|uniref:Uncharacterized protein n=1 Tax=Trichinella zimbabwensis TaxID=268475 RepID=A0A0V1GFX7_9BILA|nr:hypothetical protein T11_10338 [Trichinella zimbabwensis]